MTIAVLHVSFQVLAARSLKHKRAVVRSIKDRLRNAFNVAVAEVGAQDRWAAAQLGIVTIGTDGRYASGVMERVRGTLEANPAIRITEAEMEIL